MKLKNLCRDQLVIANGLYWRYSYDYYLDSMQRMGVQNIELHGNSSHYPCETLSEAELGLLKRKISDAKLRLITVAHDSSYSYPNIASEKKELRLKTLELYRKMLYHASVLGAPQIQLLPGHGAFDDSREENRKRAVESLIAICEEAEKYGIYVILENSSPHNTNVANTTAEILEIFDEVGSNLLVSMLDFCSVAKAGDDFMQAYRALGDRMRYIHACDGTPMGHLVPGEGELDVEGHLRFLDDENYKGYITYEIDHDLYNMEPEKHIQRGLDYMYERMEK